MGVEVIGDLTHDPVEGPSALAEATVRRISQPVEHVGHSLVRGISAVLAPHHHWGVAHLTVSDPAGVILEVPVGQLGCLAELAELVRCQWR